MGRFAQIMNAAQALAAPLIPPACAICREPVNAQGVLCPTCWSDIAFLNPGGCHKCGAPALLAEGEPAPLCDGCFANPMPWRRGRAVFRYDGSGRRLVLSLKHGDRLETLPLLGRWMARVGGDLLAQADLLVPVPLHWRRRLKRRHNQAAGLARAVARAAGMGQAFAPRALIRPRMTPNQGHRSRADRAANVAGVFAPGPEVPRMQGASVLLVDDVLTTGATLAECARACLHAGALHVDILVLALVVPENPAYIRVPDEDEDHESS